jgi:acetylornithine deacetylase/succinyl-diaminopimelate desuccinylase-like protein
MDHSIQPQVLAQVDRTALIDLASDLIRIPSFKTEETPLARFLADFFQPRGYHVELQEIEPGRFQTIATLKGTGGGASLMLIEPPYVPDLCTILVDVHFVPGMTVDGIVADIRRVLDPLTPQDPDLRYAIEIPPPKFFTGRRRLVMDPLDVPVDTEIVRAWRAAIRR